MHIIAQSVMKTDKINLSEDRHIVLVPRAGVWIYLLHVLETKR